MLLTKAEEQVMGIVWKHDQVFIRQIIAEFPEPKPAYNTVGTFLKILEKKGFVSREKFGSTFAYSPKISRTAYTKTLLKNLVTNYFDGSSARLLSFFAQSEDLDVDMKTIEELKKKLKDD